LNAKYFCLLSAVLSGKELFNYNSSLFVDDEAAINAQEENELAEESKRSEEAEIALEKIDQERAQAEQARLAELQRIEIEARMFKFEEKKRLAALGNSTFRLGDVVINEAVFDEDEVEDLEVFPDIVETIQNEDEGGNDDKEGNVDNFSFEINLQEDNGNDDDDKAESVG